MTRLAALLAFAIFCAPSAKADGFATWGGAAQAAFAASDSVELWAGAATEAAASDVAFAPVATGLALSAEAVAAAIESDKSRLALASLPPARGLPAADPVDRRIEAVFDDFTAFGPDGRAYASQDFARSAPGEGPVRVVRAGFADRSLIAFLFPHD